jgi:DAK2 domain
MAGEPLSVATAAAAVQAGAAAVSRHGGASEGDRTMLDALLPAARTLGEAARAGDRQTDRQTDLVGCASAGGADTRRDGEGRCWTDIHADSQTLLEAPPFGCASTRRGGRDRYQADQVRADGWMDGWVDD